MLKILILHIIVIYIISSNPVNYQNLNSRPNNFKKGNTNTALLYKIILISFTGIKFNIFYIRIEKKNSFLAYVCSIKQKCMISKRNF